jgi:oxygen-independent coproporphyrinogen-3 oxidase
MRTNFDIAPDAEITVECAPGQLADETLAALAASGVNRVSLGVQSFTDREAAVSGRLHTRTVALAEIKRLRAAGIDNINVDLIAGLAGQTFASWDESLAILAESDLPHVSLYMLEVDQDSRLGRELLAHGARYHAELVPTDDAIAQMYERAIELLPQSSLKQYEISNFARPGMESRHNLRYWRRRPYLGLGLDASSMLHEISPAQNSAAPGRILRTTTTDDLKAFFEASEPVESSWLTPAQQHEEAWFLGLRMNAGVNLGTLEQEFSAAMVEPALQVVGRLVETGLLFCAGQTVQLTAQGRQLSNDVFQEFIGLGAAVAKGSDLMKKGSVED